VKDCPQVDGEVTEYFLPSKDYIIFFKGGRTLLKNGNFNEK
jgi:hypothetical protein